MVKLCLYLELLKPIIQLSLNFEKKKIKPVSATIAFGKVKGNLLKLKNKDTNNFNQIKTMKKYIKELEDGKVEYKTIRLKNLEGDLETCEQKKRDRKNPRCYKLLLRRK